MADAARADRAWSRRVAVLATIAASGVAVVYLPQPILTLVAAEFGLAADAAGFATVAVQAGYALGVVLFVSLGDRFAPRAQVTWQVAATAVAVMAAGLAPTYGLYTAACFVAGATATYGQILIATALRIAPPDARARTVAVLLGAFILGLFTVRTALGSIASALGWREVVVAIGVILLALAPVARLAVPVSDRPRGPGLGRILASIPRIARGAPLLMLMSAVHALAFSAFIATWAMSTVHAVEDLGWSVAAASLLGLAGVAAGALTILLARIHRHISPRLSVTVALVTLCTGAAITLVAGSWAVGLAAGLFLMTLGMITSQVTTQAQGLMAVDPAESGRANTVYVATTFFAGASFTALADTLYRSTGFVAVAALALVLTLLALGIALRAAPRLTDRPH